MPSGAFNICCPRDCVSQHNGGTSGASLKPLRVDSALRALSTLRDLRGAPEVPPLCRETQSLGMLNAPFGINELIRMQIWFGLTRFRKYSSACKGFGNKVNGDYLLRLAQSIQQIVGRIFNLMRQISSISFIFLYSSRKNKNIYMIQIPID